MGTLDYTDLPLPIFCPECGKPYPWTEAKLKAAQDLSDELDLSKEERDLLKKSFDDIVLETPHTNAAVSHIKRILDKVGKPVADAFRDIFVDIVSETIKKIIWPS